MGLNERRKIKELQDTTFPARSKEIEEISGKAVPYEVNWETFADDLEALNYVDNVACHRINMALRPICSDDMGKQAVRDGLTLIKIKNVKTKGEMQLTFAGGTLEMNGAFAQRLDGAYDDGTIRKLLIDKL